MSKGNLGLKFTWVRIPGIPFEVALAGSRLIGCNHILSDTDYVAGEEYYTLMNTAVLRYGGWELLERSGDCPYKGSNTVDVWHHKISNIHLAFKRDIQLEERVYRSFTEVRREQWSNTPKGEERFKLWGTWLEEARLQT